MAQVIEDFLQRHIEGYLFGDMDNMAKIKLAPGEWAGACGYPMVATTLSVIELLGVMVSTTLFDASPAAGRRYFSSYWNNYLGKVDARYLNQSLANLMYSLSRNSLAHMYLTKPGIYVTKDQPQLHLEHDTGTQQLILDATKFYVDFKDSYLCQIKPIVEGQSVGGVSRQSMQSRLDDITREYGKNSSYWFNSLPTTSSTKVRSYVSSASTSFPPASTSTTNNTVGPTTFTPPQV